MRPVFFTLIASLAVLTAGLAIAPAEAETMTFDDPENTLLIEVGLDYGADGSAPAATGTIAVKLLPDVAPGHVARIKELAREGFYDGVPFHRVIDGFMAQTGDGQFGNGTGGSSKPDLKAEFSTVPYERGTVGMARTSNPNSANSQFFIMFARHASLDGEYTVFGQVIDGMDVVDQIKKGSRSQNGSVASPQDRMVAVTVAADK